LRIQTFSTKESKIFKMLWGKNNAECANRKLAKELKELEGFLLLKKGKGLLKRPSSDVLCKGNPQRKRFSN